MKNKLKGLLLAGGKSSRMGSSKAHIVYRDDQPEWLRISKLMETFCDSVCISCQKDQAEAFNLPVILDSGNGPLSAIHEAFQADSECAWLVVACDLPLLDEETLLGLVNQRSSDVVGTYYESAFDGKPEPLCAIYEKDFKPIIEQSIVKEQYCPRALLSSQNAKAVKLQNTLALKNVNTPAEKLEVEALLDRSASKKMVEIRYYGQLREIANKDSEFISTYSVTPSGLYEQLQINYQFPHKQKQLMVAINGDFSTWDARLIDGDELVFIPPVAGG